MKSILSVFSVFAIALAFTSCSKSNSGPSNNASVNFVNGTSGTTNVSVKANGTAVSGVNNLAFQASSGYKDITAGSSVPVNYYLTAQGTPLCSGTASLVAGAHYSIFAGGLITGPTFLVSTDDLSSPANGYAKVRFVNLSSDNLNEAFSIGSQKIDSNVSANTCTPFFQVSAVSGTGILAADPAHLTSTYIAQLASQNISAGRIYTILLTGTSSGSGTSALTLTVLTNN